MSSFTANINRVPGLTRDLGATTVRPRLGGRGGEGAR